METGTGSVRTVCGTAVLSRCNSCACDDEGECHNCLHDFPRCCRYSYATATSGRSQLPGVMCSTGNGYYYPIRPARPRRRGLSTACRAARTPAQLVRDEPPAARLDHVVNRIGQCAKELGSPG